MNDSQVLTQLAETDAYAPGTAMPTAAWSRETARSEIERRMGMDTRDTTNDTGAPLGVTEQTEPGAIGAVNDTPTKQTGKRRWSGALVAAAAFGVVVVIVGAAVLLTTVDSDDAATPAAGPITFRAKINLSDQPASGTFVVDNGADVLGCSGGTVVQLASSEFSIGNNVMTCDSGPNTGTFTVDHGSQDVYVWNVVESSGDFAGLQGEGSWDFLLTDPGNVVETFTGDIEYTP